MGARRDTVTWRLYQADYLYEYWKLVSLDVRGRSPEEVRRRIKKRLGRKATNITVRPSYGPTV